ncbi:MAG: catalase family protein [Gammaproteobacteria bacterium]
MASYLRYHDGLEQKQEHEDAIIERIVESMMRVSRRVFDRHRHAHREAHAKSHGVLTGTLCVHEALPPELAQGIFVPGARYPALVRLSTAPGDIHSDKVPMPRGMAIKLLNVPGTQVLAQRVQASTQDLLLVNHPVIPFGHAAAYLTVQEAIERHMDDPDSVLRLGALIARGGKHALHAVGADSPALDLLGVPNTHILGETFHSMAALRHGDYVAKLSAAPLSANVRALAGAALDGGSDSELRDRVVAFFAGEEAEYELRVQLCTDGARMPIEDASVEWPEQDSPYVSVARLRIPAQNAYSAARRAYFDDVLTFNPWHCVEAHRPLGSIMRARLAAYEASSEFRHQMNGRARVEVEDIGQVPD